MCEVAPNLLRKHGSHLHAHKCTCQRQANEFTCVCHVLQCDEQAYDQNEQMMERILAVDDVDAVHSNCAGLG